MEILQKSYQNRAIRDQKQFWDQAKSGLKLSLTQATQAMTKLIILHSTTGINYTFLIVMGNFTREELLFLTKILLCILEDMTMQWKSLIYQQKNMTFNRPRQLYYQVDLLEVQVPSIGTSTQEKQQTKTLQLLQLLILVFLQISQNKIEVKLIKKLIQLLVGIGTQSNLKDVLIFTKMIKFTNVHMLSIQQIQCLSQFLLSIPYTIHISQKTLSMQIVLHQLQGFKIVVNKISKKLKI
ncbi:transmembrane protein, putative (macronuclear) [Tetrahymena thermophila SB210]|uniref:Transmembrane protein, putative n=1 Tax=Tetrahymena thermophila (strain SB210) TaxID=312017 RepID=W7XBB4_TETTS|nr:transmembrane protein, putative [Tetrahymena thermophila SB210]EWS73718.1 transmembrane protein, putative [Tetrahymena thermophila SB210]|eukprot:XP_012653756.1 transmembrane protein, putative [Tetrahymena thermophila SB210]